MSNITMHASMATTVIRLENDDNYYYVVNHALRLLDLAPI